MSFVRTIQCNGCKTNAPNVDRLPSDWAELLHPITGGAYHYCRTCITGFINRATGYNSLERTDR